MTRAQKKHVCSCGEEFNHGIGLRKHQRQTGHTGSRVVEGEVEAPIATEASPPPPKPSPPPPPQVEPPPPPVAKPNPPPAVTEESAPPAEEEPWESDHTVAVSHSQANTASLAQPTRSPEPSTFEQRRHKLNLVSQGLTIVAQDKARRASRQIRQSARSGADIMAEASKLALALLLLLCLPMGAYFGWRYLQAPTPIPREAPLPTRALDATQARDTVLEYLDALTKGQPSLAYKKLSPSWQKETSQTDFQQATSGLSNIRWAVDDQTLTATQQAEVKLRLSFIEEGKEQSFSALFALQAIDGAWKINGIELSPPSEHPSS